MSARYTTREFAEAGIKPGGCDQIISGDLGDLTVFMACDYHEGYIDGYEMGAGDNK